MKQWDALLGFTLTLDEPKRKVAVFKTPDTQLQRDKWKAIGKGRSRIIVDTAGHPWSFSATNELNNGVFIITVKLKW